MLLSLVALALVDSINPSALVVTLYLLSRQRAPAQVLAYVAAILATYLTLGVVMMSGLDALLPAMRPLASGRLGFVVQSLVGLAMLVYAVTAPTTARSAQRVEPRATSYLALVLLGVTVTAMELPTAVPYFAAIALLTARDLPPAQWLLLLAAYNTIFILPPVLLLMGQIVCGRRLEERYTALRERLQTGAHVTMLWILGLVGGVLLVTGVVEYAARFVMRPN